MVETSNTRLTEREKLIAPNVICAQHPILEETSLQIEWNRNEISKILNWEDNRLIAVVWPCSVHDPESALEYAQKLEKAQEQCENLLFVMRVYFEKPRTISGWKWLIRDPHLDGSNNMNLWLQIARKLLKEIAEMNVPIWTEQLDVITPQYTSDFISWSAIWARSTEDQWHREMASWLSSPVGFKNWTGWNIKLALDAIEAASTEDRFVWINMEWEWTTYITGWNPDAHMILRWWGWKVNYQLHDIESVASQMEARWIKPKIIVDASHQNSPKWYEQQLQVIDDIIFQITNERSNLIKGIMMESHLEWGKQNFKYWTTTINELNPNQSITDGCLPFDDTLEKLIELDAAVWKRKAA